MPAREAEYATALSATHGASSVNRDLSVLAAIFESARREELVDHNPARSAERPRMPRRRWRVLSPAETGMILRAFDELAAKHADDGCYPRARLVFLTAVLTGLRRSELIDLRWSDIDLIENVLHVRESKSEAGRRTIAIPPDLAEELWQHRRSSLYKADPDYVFAHPRHGTRLYFPDYGERLEEAKERAGIEGYLRPGHDLRHTSLTQGALLGESGPSLMARAGHANFAVTRTYLDLAGRPRREDAERLARRMLSTGGVEPSTRLTPSQPV